MVCRFCDATCKVHEYSSNFSYWRCNQCNVTFTAPCISYPTWIQASVKNGDAEQMIWVPKHIKQGFVLLNNETWNITAVYPHISRTERELTDALQAMVFFNKNIKDINRHERA